MTTNANNAALAPWTGPFGGIPPFDAINAEDFAPALEASMALYRADIEAIVRTRAPANFANTLEALERAGGAYRRVATLVSTFASTMSTPLMQSVEREFAPKRATLRDEIFHNAQLFDRIRTIYDARETMGLTHEQSRLADVIYHRFVRAGAALSGPDKARLGQINQRLASLYTAFSQNILADEESDVLTLETKAELVGLPSDLVAAAAREATRRGAPGTWMIANTRSMIEPFLTFSAHRGLREKALRMWTGRADKGDAHDNNAHIAEILQLRDEKALLLGYQSFAHLIADGQMSKTPDAAMALLRQVWTPALARAREEIADLVACAAAEGSNEAIQAFDYRYYAEKVRQARYDFSEAEVKAYLQLDNLRAGMFWAAGELFGLTFVKAPQVSVYHPDVEVFEVSRDGVFVGLWYFDLFARPGKRSGAWMSEYRTQQKLQGVTPIVSNNANFTKAPPGEPVLLSWSDAVTLFHEFGHGLHGLNSAVTYPSLAGTSVVRDFVELPSQLNEHWLATEALLSRFALHYQTGAPMPAALREKVLKAKTFRQGFNTAEYLACAIIDLEAHLAPQSALSARRFERASLDKLHMPSEIMMRHRLPHFSHIFSSEGYAAGYYNYIWADALTADAAEAFAEAPGGFYDKTLAKKLLDDILSVGNSVEAGEAFRRFRGRDQNIDALMRDRGFA